MKKPYSNFTKQINDWQLKCLQEAGASGLETRVYIRLVRFAEESSKYDYSFDHEAFAKMIGTSRQNVDRALRGLEKRIFFDCGNAVPVLKKVSKGCKGHRTVHHDNIMEAYDRRYGKKG